MTNSIYPEDRTGGKGALSSLFSFPFLSLLNEQLAGDLFFHSELTLINRQMWTKEILLTKNVLSLVEYINNIIGTSLGVH